MSYNSHALSIEDALATSQATYDVDFQDWGHRKFPDLEENIRFPSTGQRAIPSTLAGLSIGPRSTVDRCWVTWDRQKTLTIVDDVTGDITSRPRPLSVQTPLSYAQATKAGGLTPNIPPVHEAMDEAMQTGLLYAFAHDEGTYNSGVPGYFRDTTILPVSYTDQFGVVRTFDSGGVGGAFEAPFLNLTLNLRPPFFAPPTKRFVMTRSFFAASRSTLPKRRQAFLPIFGRKHIRISAASITIGADVAGINDIWIGLVRNVNEDSSSVFEVNAGVVLGLGAKVPIEFAIDNPNADYLSIYTTGPAALNYVGFSFVAED